MSTDSMLLLPVHAISERSTALESASQCLADAVRQQVRSCCLCVFPKDALRRASAPLPLERSVCLNARCLLLVGVVCIADSVQLLVCFPCVFERLDDEIRQITNAQDVSK